MVMLNESVLLVLSFGVLVIGGYKFLKTAILRVLDTKIQKILDELDKTVELKSDAERTLSGLQSEYALAQKNGEEMIKCARKEAETIANEAKAKLASVAQRGEELVEMHRMRQDALLIEDFRRDVVLSVLKLVESEWLDKLQEKDHIKILEHNRDALRKLWN